MSYKTIEKREDGQVVLIDQRKLPAEETYKTCETWEDVADSIRTMVVRGAPAIGVTAAYGVALAARTLSRDGASGDSFRKHMDEVLAAMSTTRPTAVNLFWALERMRRAMAAMTSDEPSDMARKLDEVATSIHEDDARRCAAMGNHGAELIPRDARVLTHCNTGALATGGIGTALGVIRTAAEAGKNVQVWADETRPWLQGSRLTTWECMKLGIPVRLIADSVAADLMRRGEVDVVILGADRIAANGDVANKIGTYSVAVNAAHHGIPFYVAAPVSTIDPDIATGTDIPIEQRDPEEVTRIGDEHIAPEGVDAFNPAFDVTPARLIKGIVTEVGVARPPYTESLARQLG